MSIKEITVKPIIENWKWDNTDFIELLSGKRIGDNNLGEKVDFKRQWEKMHNINNNNK
jgi:hypothetical protein